MPKLFELRYIAQGFGQLNGVYYYGTYATVMDKIQLQWMNECLCRLKMHKGKTSRRCHFHRQDEFGTCISWSFSLNVVLLPTKCY